MVSYKCSVQSCLFVQSWPGNFLVQCRENLCSVGAVFAATGYYQKINRFKIKIAEKWCYSDDIGFFPVQCCPKSITTLLNRIFSCGMFSQGFYLYNVVPKVLRQHWTGFFPLQCCLEPIEQHCKKFLPVQCFPKSIKTTLNSIFSCEKFSRVSRTTLHRVLHVQ